MKNGALIIGPGQDDASAQIARQLTRINLKRQLEVDAVLIVGLQRPSNPEDPTAQTFLSIETDGVEVMEMVGIIHKLMTDVNKQFEDEGMPGPFSDARPFVQPVVEQEPKVTLEPNENSFIGFSPVVVAEESTPPLQLGDLVEVQSKSNPRFSKLTFTITEFSEVNGQPMACGEYGCFAIHLLTKI